MPGHRRDEEERIPEFYLSPSVDGQAIDPQVVAASKQIWPWLWGHVGRNLGDHDQAAEVAEQVARRVSRFVEAHPGEVRSLEALCRATAVNVVATARSKEGRIQYRGLGHEVEAKPAEAEPDWQSDVELGILIDQVASHLEGDIRTMFNLRLLGRTWDQVGEHLGLTGGQARLRFQRAVEAFLPARAKKTGGAHEEPK